MHIAILEDDSSQIELLTHWLHRAGHHPHPFDRGIKLLDAMKAGGVDLLLLDWNVPDMDGLEVLRHVRRIFRSSIPVLFVTGRASEEDVIKALREGADDYVRKPVRRMELLARIEAVARGAGYLQDQPDVFEVGCFLVDYNARKIVRTKIALQLTLKEFELSVLLLRNVGRLLARRYILETIWSSIPADHSRTLDTHMARVRSKLGLIPQHGWRLSVVYGHGYRLEQLKPSVPAIR
jgi:two-component system response regulator RegX3